MKRLIIVIALLGAQSSYADLKEAGANIFKKALVYPKDTNTSLEIKNKAATDIFVAIRNDGKFLVKDGKKAFKVAAGTTEAFSPNINAITELLVWKRAPQDITRDYDTYRFIPGKTIYVTWDADGYFRPQTGPGIGILKKTDTALSLKNNVDEKDIKKVPTAVAKPAKMITAEEEVFVALGLGKVKEATPDKILGVAPRADKDTARAAYKKLQLKWHPDKAKEADRPLATKISAAVSNAYTAMAEQQAAS